MAKARLGRRGIKQKFRAKSSRKNFNILGTVVVAQLIERSLPKPEVRVSNLVIGKLYITYLLSKDENKRKRGPNFQKTIFNISSQTHGCPRKNLSRS